MVGGGGFMKGLVWGVAAYLVIHYVWPKIQGGLGSLGGGSAGAAYSAYPAGMPDMPDYASHPGMPGPGGMPGHGTGAQPSGHPGFPHPGVPRFLGPPIHYGMPHGSVIGYNPQPQFQMAQTSLHLCKKNCEAMFRRRFPNIPHPVQVHHASMALSYN